MVASNPFTVEIGERIRGGAKRHRFPMAHEDAQILALLLPSMVLPSKVMYIALVAPEGHDLIFRSMAEASEKFLGWPNPDVGPSTSDPTALQFVIFERGSDQHTDRPWQFAVTEDVGRRLADLLQRVTDHKRVLWMGMFEPSGETMTVKIGPTGQAVITVIPQSAIDEENDMLDRMDRMDGWRLSRAEEAAID